MVFAKPRLSRMGLRVWPEFSFSSSKFCILRAPTWKQSHLSMKMSMCAGLVISVTTGRPVASCAPCAAAPDPQPSDPGKSGGRSAASTHRRGERSRRPPERAGNIDDLLLALDRARTCHNDQLLAADNNARCNLNDRVVRMELAVCQLERLLHLDNVLDLRVKHECVLVNSAGVADQTDNDGVPRRRSGLPLRSSARYAGTAPQRAHGSCPCFIMMIMLCISFI